jgi:hypothetical protein
VALDNFLGLKLVWETLLLAGTEFVEMSAVMAKYNPFPEKAGMRRVAEQRPGREALNISKILADLGFNLQLLCSEKYVQSTLKSLKHEDRQALKRAFMKYGHPRFLKSFSQHLPYGNHSLYEKWVMRASLKKLAQLVKICGFLPQTKVYLFWSRDETRMP